MKQIKPVTTIRNATPADLPQLIDLMAAHAAFERAALDRIGLAERLMASLIGPGARATCAVAEVDRPLPRLVGYATMANEFSTWSGRDYLHMDTLYVDEFARNTGIGAALLDAAVDHARRRGLGEVQWQTPSWNDRAIRFYERAGAVSSIKHRFRLPVPRTSSERRTNQDTLALFTQAWAEQHLDRLRFCLHADVEYAPSIPVAGAPFRGIDSVVTGIESMWDYDTGAQPEFGPSIETATTITRTWTYRFPDRTPVHGVDIFTFIDGAIIRKDAYRREANQPAAWPAA
jgi:GNAT superfamily N-acetyltransferase